MPALPSTAERKPVAFRIGEVAKLTDLTTRTLRYWEELGLVRPSSHGSTGERHYSRADVTRGNAESVTSRSSLASPSPKSTWCWTSSKWTSSTA